MTTEIARQTSAPTAADLAKALSSPQLVEKLMTFIAPEGGEYLPGTPITDTHRRLLVERAGEIEAMMEDNRVDVTIAIVSTLLTAFPHRGDIGAEEAATKTKAYRIALQGAPTWSVEEAARRWIRAEIGNASYAPTPAELRKASDHLVLVAKGRAIHMRKLAAMPVRRHLTDEQRAEMLQRIADITKPKTVIDKKEAA